jgi:hypothetical protein
VLVDRSVVEQLGPRWVVEPVRGLVDLRGDAVDASVLRGRRGVPADEPPPAAADEADAPLRPRH